MEKLTVFNTSPLPGHISFCYQHDSNASTFLLDPPNMSLEPNEGKVRRSYGFNKYKCFLFESVVGFSKKLTLHQTTVWKH